MSMKKIKMKEPKIPRLGRLVWHRALPRKDDPSAVAWSVAIGVFIGVLPTFGFSLALTLVVVSLLKLPKLPGSISSFIAIPPTIFPFFYPVGYLVGRQVITTTPMDVGLIEIIKNMRISEVPSTLYNLAVQSGDHLLAFFLGTAIEAFVFALFFFTATYLIMRIKQKHLIRDRLLRKILKSKKGVEEGAPPNGE